MNQIKLDCQSIFKPVDDANNILLVPFLLSLLLCFVLNFTRLTY